MFFNQFLPVFSIALTFLTIIGGYVAFKQGAGKQSSSIQTATIDALKVRVDTLESQAKDDTKELARLRQIISTIRHALKRRGLHIEIEGEYVTLIDADGQRSTQAPPLAKVTTRVKPVRPIKLNPIEDDDDDTA